MKRPRLSMFSRDVAPDETLSRARWRNDLSLKSRFEAIFAKYAHDFTGVGDEIEVATGSVVVNNGHLEAMEDEGDIGVARPPSRTLLKRTGVINGGSLLRAMTAAPEDRGLCFEDIREEDVVMSIEAMAENAAGYSGDDDTASRSAGDAEDVVYGRVSSVVPVSSLAPSSVNLEEEVKSGDEELFQTTDNISAGTIDHRKAMSLGTGDGGFGTGWVRNTDHGKQIYLSSDNESDIMVKQEDDEYWPGCDPLSGDRDNDRHSSPDSLFEEDSPSDFLDGHLENEVQEHAYPELPGNGREVSDEAILDRFGPKIGPQIIDVLQKRRAMIDAHIEPAWRLPDIGLVFPKPKLEMPPGDLHLSPEPSSGRKHSLWRDSQISRPVEDLPSTIPRRVRGSSQLSNESEDPLQEDFHPVKDIDDLDDAADDADGLDDADDENLEVVLDDVHNGICPFCRKQFSVTGSVYVHWDELIKKSAQDDVHDMAYIRHQRRLKRRRTQFPKVTVHDFYTIIKLREVDKLDWQEIHDRRFFRQRPPTSLQSIHYQYRTLAKTDEELADERRSWTAEEDARLLRFCEDPTMTFEKLRKLMRTRTQAELGNRLASIWMQAYTGQGLQIGSPHIEPYPNYKTVRSRLESSLRPGQTRPAGLKLDRLRRSWSVDSMDSLFQLDLDAGGNGDRSESDDGLFGTT